MKIAMQEFFINNRFLVNPVLNRVLDTEAEVETHLEPRIMQLLTLLCENSGGLVTREKLVKEIWNGYGGADEGLTQAISFLRKTLDDSSKEIIKTIPKKGYILQASVTPPVKPGDSADKVNVPTKKRLVTYSLLAMATAAVITVALIYGDYFREDENLKQPVIETTFPGNYEEEDNNPLTTITTTDSLQNRYRLVMVGDRRPKFYVNDSLQLNQEPYDALIDKLAKELWRRQKEAEDR